MSNPKPIAVVYVNPNTLPKEDGFWKVARNLVDDFSVNMPDYYWFVLPDYDATRIELEVFYEKNFTEIQYQELKEIIEESLKKQINDTRDK